MPRPSSQSQGDLESEMDSLADREYRSRYLSRSSSVGKTGGRGNGVCCALQIVMHAVHLVIAVGIVFWVYQNGLPLEKPVETFRSAVGAQIQQTESTALPQGQEYTTPTECLKCPDEDKDEDDNLYKGIPKRDIAHIYADPSALHLCSSRPCPKEEFTYNPALNRECDFPDNERPGALKNYNDDIWCSKIHGYEQNHRFKLSLTSNRPNVHTYNYFKRASWLDDLTDSNFQLPNRQTIRVLTDGLYMVQATVHFIDNNAVMNVVKETHAHNNRTILGSCRVQLDLTPEQETSTKAPDFKIEPQLTCSVFQVMMLKENDELFMDLSANRLFWIRKDLLYMTVIKLSDYSV